jgi:6-phosphogluconate dehydrogenase
MLVMAGKPVDATIALLMEHLEEGDCIIDGGNEWWVLSTISTRRNTGARQMQPVLPLVKVASMTAVHHA